MPAVWMTRLPKPSPPPRRVMPCCYRQHAQALTCFAIMKIAVNNFGLRWRRYPDDDYSQYRPATHQRAYRLAVARLMVRAYDHRPGYGRLGLGGICGGQLSRRLVLCQASWCLHGDGRFCGAGGGVYSHECMAALQRPHTDIDGGGVGVGVNCR